MPLASTLMGVGIPGEPAVRLGYSEQVPLDGNGTTQNGAAWILRFNTNIAAGTSVGDTAFILPSDAEFFIEYFVLNTTPEPALVYPPIGDTIDNLAVNVPITIEQDKSRIFWRVEEGRWVSVMTGQDQTQGIVESVVAGTGISVNSADPANPVVSNTGVLSVTAGANISVTGTAQDPIINGVPAGVQSVTAGTGISLTGTADDPIINNTGVLSVTAGSNISVTGTAADPVINGNAGTLTSVVAGPGISVDNTNPAAPVVRYIDTAFPTSNDTAGIQAAINSVASGAQVRVILIGVNYDLSAGNVTNNGRIVSWQINPAATFTGSGTLPAISSPNYGLYTLKDGVQAYYTKGTSAAPDDRGGAPLVTASYNDNPAVVGIGAASFAYKYTNAGGANAIGHFSEALDAAGWDGVGSYPFIEGNRSHAVLLSSISRGSAYGSIHFAGQVGTNQWEFMIGSESQVKNEWQDAAAPDSFNNFHFSAAYLAGNYGGKKGDAAFVTNGFADFPFRTALFVMEDSIDHSVIYNRADVEYGINFREGSYAQAEIALKDTGKVALYNSGGTVVSSYGNGQILFPATQNPSSNANTLDDYEENTFTPAFSATGATFNYTTQTGYYTKIGNLVFVNAVVVLATSGNTLAAAALSMTGLPFPARATTPAAQRLNVQWANSTTSYVGMNAALPQGASAVTFQVLTAAATTFTANANSDALLHATNGSNIRIFGVYVTD